VKEEGCTIGSLLSAKFVPQMQINKYVNRNSEDFI